MTCANADTPTTQQVQTAAEEAVLCLINEQRAANGVPPLTLNLKLRDAARQHAQDARTIKWWAGGGSKVHLNPISGSTPQSRIRAADYCPREVAPPPPTNENCYDSWYRGGVQYQGGTMPRAAVTWWMNSQGHRTTLLDPTYRESGVAVLLGVAQQGGEADNADGGAIFVQTFGACAEPETPPIVGQGWAWGENSLSQLGDGTSIDRLMPVRPQGLSGVVAVDGGWGHSLALASDGSVWAWGWNNGGQVGDGSPSGTTRTTPVRVERLSSGVVAVASGTSHNLALTDDGSVWAWGKNDQGHLGDGTTTSRSTPVPVKLPNIGRVVAIAAGGNHSLALTTDGVVFAWGRNDFGQLGDGTEIDRLLPVRVLGLRNVGAIAGGYYHSLALMHNNIGEVWAWGGNGEGQLGDHHFLLPRSKPGKVFFHWSVRPVAIAAGQNHSLLISKTDYGEVPYSWGSNDSGELGRLGYAAPGELGQSGYVAHWKPGIVPGLNPEVAPHYVMALAGGWGHTLALREDGSVWAWGNNHAGQLGDGSTTVRQEAAQVKNVSGPVGSIASGPVGSIACGTFHSLTP